MTDERPPPARPWFDRVEQLAALRGWSLSELARRAKISRPTLYGWRDNPKKPQARSVNAVADALGIPRGEALQLAGVIGAAPEPEWEEVPRELVKAYGRGAVEAMIETVPDPEQRRLLFERLLAERRGGDEPPPTGPGAKTPPGGSRRLA